MRATSSPLIAIVFIVFIISTSCTEEPNEEGSIDHYRIDQKLYPLLFSPGSYWIYQNVEDGEFDSILLLSSVADTVGPFKTGNGYYMTNEAFNLEYYSSQTGNYYEQLVGYVITRESVHGGYVYLASFKVGDHSINASIAAIHDTLNIGGATFNRVVEMYIKKDYNISSDMRLFYSDSIGVVKRIIYTETNDSSTWNLSKYEVALQQYD